MLRLFVILIALTFTASCGGPTRGVALGADGRWVGNTAEQSRMDAETRINTALAARLGTHWRVTTTIAELPQALDPRRGGGDDWTWERATVAIDLVGDGKAVQPLTTDAVTAVVRRALADRVAPPTSNLRVEMRTAIDLPRFMTLASTAKPDVPATAPPMAVTANPRPTASSSAVLAADAAPPHANAPTHYVVQPGDTLAEISIAFYGTAQLWRLIADANPGVRNGLYVGDDVIIPIRP